ncbi:formate/nitrite transporter family protein [Lachnoclostridium sp. An196]|uniref:formate/nitrite transporter family protein n=1 Tax=Lachnoclostridium sp. An196 TaxID=1965583 RepID=UPI002E8E29F5|nr:formate/nitrite transporter family protein [Lachnoclostridium sp. An196]
MNMFYDEFMSVCNAAKGKAALMKNNPLGYFVAAVVAGIFIAFGGFVTFTLGSYFSAADNVLVRVVQPFSFAAALSLVVMAGAELFTGNNFVMASASLSKTVPWIDTVKLWIFCYVGNLAGSLAAAALFCFAGIPTGNVGAYFATTAAAKMGGTAPQLFVKAIFCNILVCLAVWCAAKMKSEAGKLIMVFWCIYVFMACGFEHSIANMTVMAVGLIAPNGVEGISLAGYVHNLLWVTLGNMVGGISVALAYYTISRKK